ncbi:MAG: peptidyl-prolyl cis-trans isomerase [Geopsychrobacter sp.]|nr:peptidyl-prolyl cis-trans isomerase [Geopsychrobacter sp.]
MSQNTSVIIQTSMGEITIELDAENAPISSENFLAYTKDGAYDGTIYHRVIPGFMIQGGGFNTDMQQKDTKSPIKNEASNGLKNVRGTLAMARTQVVDSATSQFFINLADNEFLDHKGQAANAYGYAVFAKVTAGMDVVDAIAKVATGNQGPHQDVPNEAVLIEKVTICA